MENIVFLTIAFFGILIARKFEGRFHYVLSLGLFITILLLLTGHPTSMNLGMILSVLLSITTFIYGLKMPDLNKNESISIMIAGMFISINILFKLYNWPWATQLRISLSISIVVSILYFLKNRKLTREMSFMIFWLAYSISDFVKLWS